MTDGLETFAAVEAAIRDERKAGAVHVYLGPVADQEPAEQTLDALVTARGFQTLGDAWRPVDLASAIEILTALLHRDMAYQHEVMPLERARTLAGAFVRLFGESVRCFTNGDWSRAGDQGCSLGAWDPITEATFDSGVIVVGRSHIGMVWVEDED